MEVVSGVLLVWTLALDKTFVAAACNAWVEHTYKFQMAPDGEDRSLSRLDVLGRNSSWQDNQVISRLKTRL